MGWPPQKRELAELKSTIFSQQRPCVAFIGSGVSAGCYDPWHVLIEGLCRRCGSKHKVDHTSPGPALLEAAQDAKCCSEEMYYRFLGERFGRPASRSTLLYDALFALPFKSYLTINFDPLLALKARTASLKCCLPPHVYPELDRLNVRDRSIIYLHGMIMEGKIPAPGSVVLAKGEFDQAYSPNLSLMNLLIPTLVSDPIVFIGCRLREPVMERLFGICKERQRERLQLATTYGQHSDPPPRRFILLDRPTVTTKTVATEEEVFDEPRSREAMEKAQDYYRDMDIEPVWYTAEGEDHSELLRVFEQLANLPDITPVFGWKGAPDAS